MNCELAINNKRCAECRRPCCQNRFERRYKWEQVSQPMNEYSMHELYQG